MGSSGNSAISHGSDALLDLALQGDPTALNELFAPCLPRLHRTAARLLSNRQDSEDAVQDGLLSAVRYLSKFRGRAQFSTWMHAIVANAAKSILRKQRCHPLTCSLDEPHPEHQELRLSDMLSDSRTDLEDDYARLEQSRFLAAVLRKLPASHGSILRLCDVEGLCMQEAAKRLGLSIPAAKTRHLRANRFLLSAANDARQRRMSILDLLSMQAWSASLHAPDAVTKTHAGHCAQPIPRSRRRPPRSRSRSNSRALGAKPTRLASSL